MVRVKDVRVVEKYKHFAYGYNLGIKLSYNMKSGQAYLSLKMTLSLEVVRKCVRVFYDANLIRFRYINTLMKMNIGTKRSQE